MRTLTARLPAFAHARHRDPPPWFDTNPPPRETHKGDEKNREQPGVSSGGHHA